MASLMRQRCVNSKLLGFYVLNISGSNQKNTEHLFLHERDSCGSLTTESQKLSMLFSTLRNPSRPVRLADVNGSHVADNSPG
jgi:hypothetical protein